MAKQRIDDRWRCPRCRTVLHIAGYPPHHVAAVNAAVAAEHAQWHDLIDAAHTAPDPEKRA